MVQSVKIGAIVYGVSLVDNLRDDGGKLDGRISHSNAEIEIEANMNGQAQMQSLLHEIVHELDLQYGLRLKDETIVDRLAYGIYQVIRDNPQLTALIADDKTNKAVCP